MVLLEDLNMYTLYCLSNYLDHKFDGEYEKDWRDVAILFKFTKLEIAQMGLAHQRGGHWTQDLLKRIRQQFPDCRVSELIHKCEACGRDDAANYLKSAVLKFLDRK
jgi:hypothetical protein